LEFKVTKVYLVEANDRHEARRRIVSDGETHLELISIQELNARGDWPLLGGRPRAPLADQGDGCGGVG